MAKNKYYATGKVLLVTKNARSGSIRNVFHDFNRVVYVDSWQNVKEMIDEQMQNKHGKNTRYYEVVSCDVLSLDVFKLEYEEYNWDAHKREGLAVNE